ncbi:4'-phosphopantetheinyl transferase family protein [Pedobacter sp. SAFR-022]|uniref:4'-phosphopantetheinyl transferase family protein n=1 Tax=Pedobacter sp. SAFR-022 TaxID=3436861 RepID=UPI003F7FB89B
MLQESPNWLHFSDFGCKMPADLIHIFRIATEACYPGIERDYTRVLSANELNRASRFLHIKDRINYLVRAYYVRRILSCFVPEAPEALQISRIGNKKPALENIHFNVSHSQGYVVIVVNSRPIGVDLEYIDPRFDFDLVLEQCFNDEEQAFVNEGNRRINFYSLWTRKEAVLKATGEGLTNVLRSINCLDNSIRRHDHLYNVNSFYFDEQYLLSLAALDGPVHYRYWDVCSLTTYP